MVYFVMNYLYIKIEQKPQQNSIENLTSSWQKTGLYKMVPVLIDKLVGYKFMKSETINVTNNQNNYYLCIIRTII